MEGVFVHIIFFSNNFDCRKETYLYKMAIITFLRGKVVEMKVYPIHVMREDSCD
jgi:hypothetical protein